MLKVDEAGHNFPPPPPRRTLADIAQVSVVEKHLGFSKVLLSTAFTNEDTFSLSKIDPGTSQEFAATPYDTPLPFVVI
jgi:hypothetical protein